MREAIPIRCIDVAGCARDPQCPDLDCPGHPHGFVCSACWTSGYCIAPQACHQPEPATPAAPTSTWRQKLARLLPTTRAGWGRVVGAGLGLGGLALFAQDALRRLFLST